MEINQVNSPQSDKKTPRRLIQSTLFPHRSQEKVVENVNGEGQESFCGGTDSNGKRKRARKAKSKITPSDKTPVDDLTERIESKISLIPSGLQIGINERSAEVDEAVTAMSLHSEKKIPCPRLIQSTLFPRQSEENCEENANGEENFLGSQSMENGNRLIPPDKIPVEGREALTEMIENKNSPFPNGLQIDLNERCAEADEVVVAMSLHSEWKSPRLRLIQPTLFPHQSEENSGENDNGEEEQGFCGSQSTGTRKKKGNVKNKFTQEKTPIRDQEALSDRTDRKDTLLTNDSTFERLPKAEELVAETSKSPHSRTETPQQRLIQATLLPHQPQENAIENKNDVERDEEYGEHENKSTGKRRGRPKQNPFLKTPISDQEALSVRTDRKDTLLSNGSTIEQSPRQKNKSLCVASHRIRETKLHGED